jgi:hypothetical protein
MKLHKSKKYRTTDRRIAYAQRGVIVIFIFSRQKQTFCCPNNIKDDTVRMNQSIPLGFLLGSDKSQGYKIYLRGGPFVRRHSIGQSDSNGSATFPLSILAITSADTSS